MRVICFDTETTGLSADDEIIQLSIADAITGEELLNQYYRPSDHLMKRGWDQAASVTGIYPSDVENAPSLDDPEERELIEDIFDSASLIIGYHVNYDVNMMERAGFNMSGYMYQDPMFAFASYYWTTHPNEKHLSRSSGREVDPFRANDPNGHGGLGKWIPKNLSFAADYLCGITDFGAHDSMNDVFATIEVWDAMNDIQQEVDFRGYAYDDEGEPILDDNGDNVNIDENGNPMIDPNGNAFSYVYDYTRDQLDEIG